MRPKNASQGNSIGLLKETVSFIGYLPKLDFPIRDTKSNVNLSLIYSRERDVIIAEEIFIS